jgi:hypothetical protein
MAGMSAERHYHGLMIEARHLTSTVDALLAASEMDREDADKAVKSAGAGGGSSPGAGKA